MTNNRVDPWRKHWTNKTPFWHKDEVNHFLFKHIDKLTEGKQGLKFFIPLCGKTIDMRWYVTEILNIQVYIFIINILYKDFTNKNYN